MCDEIVMPDESTIDTIGAARKAFPILVKNPAYADGPLDISQGDDETCICPLDIEAVAAANGYRVVRYEWDSSYYFEQADR